jgi:hypothetical protein
MKRNVSVVSVCSAPNCCDTVISGKIIKEVPGSVASGAHCFKIFCVLPTQFTVELYLSGLIGTVSHPDMQKIQIIRFFFENRLHWQFEI